MQGCIVDKVFTLLRSHFLSEAQLNRNNNTNINHSSFHTARFCICSWKRSPISTVSKTILPIKEYCVFPHSGNVSEPLLYLCDCFLCSELSYFCMSSLQTAPVLNFSLALPPPLSLSLSLWRWGQRAISWALQTSLGGETLSTVSAGAEQGSPGNKERHKLNSPLHPAVSRTKLFPQSRFRQPVTVLTLSLFSFGAG